jgi:hypothetical protein
MTYTPSTDDVRGSYADGQWYARHRLDGTVDEFDRWLAEYTRQQREGAWDQGNEAALWDKNPYRPETPPFNIHKWADEVRKAND